MLKSFRKVFPLILMALFVLPTPASAHSIGGNGIASGIIHPFSGIDHLLAMVAVGIISTKFGGKAIWIIPATFVASMVLGGIMAIAGLRLPYVETAISLSLIGFGILMSFSHRFSIMRAMFYVALFALFHGHAHGEEIPLIAHPVMYVTSFVLSTTLLHITGVFIGKYAKESNVTSKMLKYSGAVLCFLGVYLTFIVG